MTKYKRFTFRDCVYTFSCTICSRQKRCIEGKRTGIQCGHEAADRLQKLEDLIEDGKLIFIDGDGDEMVQIKVSRSWLKEMHRILHEKDIDC